jgi:hypothetical protein
MLEPPMLRLFAMGLSILLCACASAGAGEVAPGREFTMEVGASVVLADASTLRYVGIGNDSRCPPGVQCIRAGDADILFDFTPEGGGAARLTLNSERTRSAAIDGWRLELVELAPGGAPPVTLRALPEDKGGTP